MTPTTLHPLLASAAAVIFDFDGVLVDSEPLHEEAIKRTAAGLGWTMTREHFLRMVGKGDEHAFDLLGREHGRIVGPEEMRRLCALKHEACLALIAESRFTVQPGARELVERVSSVLPAGVCSGSRRAVVHGMLEASGLVPFMRTVITHEDVTRPKPDPEGYRLAAARLNVPPERCTVIEDSPTGIRAAKAAGMRVIGVCHSFEAPRLYEADATLARIADLLDVPPPLMACAGSR